MRNNMKVGECVSFFGRTGRMTKVFEYVGGIVRWLRATATDERTRRQWEWTRVEVEVDERL